MYHITGFRGCAFGSRQVLTEAQLAQLWELIQAPEGLPAAPLGGRGAAAEGRLDQVGPVWVKGYRRGGMVRRLVRRHYLRLGAPRSRCEFEMLEAAGRLGIPAPRPVCFAWRGRVLYRAWLVTAKIPGAVSLAVLAGRDPSRCRGLMDQFAALADALLRHRLLHADFHPGNVLVDAENRLYLVDFDRARFTPLARRRLAARYLARWSRAVAAHRLPPVLTEAVQAALSPHLEAG